MRHRSLAVVLSLLTPLGLAAAPPPEGPPTVKVRVSDSVPLSRDPWQTARFPGNWDAQMREPKPAPSGKTRTVVFHFEGARGLDAAVDSLACRHGLFLNYEDGPWVAGQDVRELPSPSLSPMLMPASERLDFEYVEDPETKLPLEDAHDLLEDLVDAHRQQGGHGRFRVERLDDGIASIVPSAVLDERGKWSAVEPVLSRKVTIEAQRRTVAILFDRVLSELNKDAPYPVVLIEEPLNIVHQTTVELGASNEPARDVLIRAIRALPYRYNMTLRFDPMGRKYYLYVMAPCSWPQGGTISVVSPAAQSPSE